VIAARARMRGVSLRNALLVVAAVVALGWWLGGAQAVRHSPGVLVPAVPKQGDVPAGMRAFEKEGFTITPLATFALEARVLSREDYSFDTGAAISPTDLTLGWGPMSDSAVLERLSISQGTRWWRWYSDDPPIGRSDIEGSAANMHMIPADDGVASALSRVREGDVVALRGYLVEAVRADGWRWRSSLSRSDTGSGACELIWVESLSVRPM
jgi:hypothetical protein